MNDQEFSLNIIHFLIIIGSAIFSYFGTLIIIKLALRYGLIDEPGERRSHMIATPRGGGMAIVLTFLIFLIATSTFFSFERRTLWGVLLAGSGISILGFLDDLFTLHRTPRIIAWILITVISLVFGIELQSISVPLIGTIRFGFLSPLITFIWLIGVTNFFNFMDGINGLTGFEALIAAGFLAGIAYYSENMLVFIISVIIFGSVMGFLPHNFPKAKIFLGDGGSNFLGYIFAALAIIGSQTNHGWIPFLLPVGIISMFLLDAGTTLIRRLPKGKDWLEPHRDHYYQRLIKLGYTHTQVTLLYCALNLILGVIAILSLQSNETISFGLLLVSLFPFLIVVIFTNKQEKIRQA